jgi:hypothetical protein
MNMEMLRDYLAGLTSIKFLIGPDIPDMPDQVGIVTPEPGFGFMNDGLFEAVGFRVEVRGMQNKTEDVKALASQVDRLIEFGNYPHELWGSWVISGYRVGGGPAPRPLDSGRRIIYQCSYIAQEATD